MDILNLMKEHQDIILTGGAFLIGLIIPKAKANLFGKKIGQKIPKKAAIFIADQLDAVEKGLRQQDVNGNAELVSNIQVSKEFDNLKINLGLDQVSKEKVLK
ncbi:hypothetical protein [uncultured Cetobacterium sp.]|uniref:hypothetical protein n=1 Tax=uncultured Cetobacterium sp. TaxID=527638 RepID=UPI00263506EE|nr:hypothetical protein [uncultured Cetobacterium sp.]